MRPNGNRRPRGRGGHGGGGNHSGGGGSGGGGGGKHNRPPNRNQSFDSSGPDNVRVRGNAHQIFDKYQALGREAAASGDRIIAESYYQHAEHYFRLIQQMGGGFQHQRDNRLWGDEETVEGGQGNAPQEDPNASGPTVTPLVSPRPHDPAQQDQPDIAFEPIANRGD